MNNNVPSEIPLILNDGICKTTYLIPPDTIVELQYEPDTFEWFAVLEDDSEYEISKELIELVTRCFPEVSVKERFSFMRFMGRL